MSEQNSGESPLLTLESRLGVEWTAIRQARLESDQHRGNLRDAFAKLDCPDTSLVIFGSVARRELTASSDLDWLLLVDGQSQPDHIEQEREVARLASKFKEPGRSGLFGCMVSSHSLVHQIGGEDDTNSNTTRRVLLLLESWPAGNREAYDRVRRQILNRYLRDDRGLTHGSGSYRVPRFLLNDLTRYWRTVTVDFVYKQRAEAGKKWAIRNAKLRMSRKLVFASGLLRCFSCHLDTAARDAHASLKGGDVSRLLLFIERGLQLTPLEVLAAAACRPAIPSHTSRLLFSSYDRFLQLLNDGDRRAELESVSPDDLGASKVWNEIRDASHDFETGLRQMFFEDDGELRDLTMRYGVF